MGSQIVGWIGEIQPASPKDDAPGLTKKKDDKKDDQAKADGNKDQPADKPLGGPGQVPTGPMGGGQLPTGPIDVTGTPAATAANN
jgi:hypothetical protein